MFALSRSKNGFSAAKCMFSNRKKAQNEVISSLLMKRVNIQSGNEIYIRLDLTGGYMQTKFSK